MLGLYRAGRQVDALRAFQRMRKQLAEELGVEPSTELSALERAILNHDPSLAVPSGSIDPVTASLPIPATSFVGRASELDVVADALFSARLVTITGAGGVGKTRVAFETASRTAGSYARMVLVELAPINDPAVAAAANPFRQLRRRRDRPSGRGPWRGTDPADPR